MNIQTKKLPKNLAEILVEMSFQEMEPFYQQALEELGKEVKIPGFRPGKAPIDLIKKEVGEMKILEQGAEKAINEKYPEIIKN
ncbi:MAG: trigger factor family protein, partial [Patescibacteria group bacterium]|nr:trigger factor family protein [Patescibacteria group bacterium]